VSEAKDRMIAVKKARHRRKMMKAMCEMLEKKYPRLIARYSGYTIELENIDAIPGLIRTLECHLCGSDPRSAPAIDLEVVMLKSKRRLKGKSCLRKPKYKYRAFMTDWHDKGLRELSMIPASQAQQIGFEQRKQLKAMEQPQQKFVIDPERALRTGSLRICDDVVTSSSDGDNLKDITIDDQLNHFFPKILQDKFGFPDIKIKNDGDNDAEL